MRLQAQKLTALISSSYGVRSKIHVETAKLLRKAQKRYRLLWQKTPGNVLALALFAYRLNKTEDALGILESGLNQHPGAEKLLELYLVISYDQETFTRFANFIKPDNRSLCETLSTLHVPEADPNCQHVESCRRDGLTWLTEKVIDKKIGDILTLWRLADLLEHTGKPVIAKRIYQILAGKETRTPEEFVYASLSDYRLGNIEDGFRRLELGLASHPGVEGIRQTFVQHCYLEYDFDRYRRLNSLFPAADKNTSASMAEFYRSAFLMMPPEIFILKFNEIELKHSPDDFRIVQEEFLASLRMRDVAIENARSAIFFSRFLDIDAAFAEKVFSTLHSRDWGRGDQRYKYLLKLAYRLTPPMATHRTSDAAAIVRQFIAEAQALARKPMVLKEPLRDLGRYWCSWQSLFCLAEPRLYRHAISAFETLAFRLWPKLDYISPHIRRPVEAKVTANRKIRIGFTVLDSMPMMSGLMERLDKSIFETVFLRPGGHGDSITARDWVARADKVVEYSGNNVYAAIDTIAEQALDILVSGPSMPQIFFPLMARLAHLQMVLLEPNWPDGIRNTDYYISWQMAEPANYREFYQTPVSLMRTPPYWIERSSLGKIPAAPEEAGDDIRRRLLGLAPHERFYICPNITPKIHPVMDDILAKILAIDSDSRLVFVRSEHPISQTLKVRMKEKLGSDHRRVIFSNTLKRDDAHALLLTADCYLDSYPIGGMSSSFDGLMLGVPIVTLPAAMPFGRWTAAIYEYIGVTGLTARDADDYIAIAVRLANDKDWRREKSAEIREKSSLYVESKASFDEFQHFLIEAWRRKQLGLPPANWTAGEWQPREAPDSRLSA